MGEPHQEVPEEDYGVAFKGEPVSQSEVQVGGDWYKTMKHQPLEMVLDDEGYEAFRGACYAKIYKYMKRDKANRLIDLKKASHILNWLIEETKE